MTARDKKITFLITTLALYQTEFWKTVGLALRQQGFGVAFLSYDDRSTQILRDTGLVTYSASETPLTQDPGAFEFEELMSAYGMTPTSLWLSHERYTFAQYDTAALRTKMLRYLSFTKHAIDQENTTASTLYMIQELGGFVSVVASYFAAKSKGLDHWFIEPSFFRGRLFFLKNQFSSAQLPTNYAPCARVEVEQYLRSTIEKQTIAIPLKDKHQYRSALKKVVNRRNLRRLLEKLRDKYVYGQHQEFGHIGHHVKAHTRMVINGIRLRHYYKPLEHIGPFVYYPLHVPADMALTLRSPAYLDQLAFIEYLLRCIPGSHCLAIKEHPAMTGAIESGRLVSLLKRFDNLALLPPTTNNFEVLRRSALIVSINSKSGAEALLLGKSVLLMGDAFYRTCPSVTPVSDIEHLPRQIEHALSSNGQGNRPPINRWFEHVWTASKPGELYVDAPQNVAEFTESLLRATIDQDEADVRLGQVA